MGKKTFKQRFFSRFRHNTILDRFFFHTGKDVNPSKWIFILGCYNSGTTLLDQILTLHPLIGGLNDEGVMLTNKLPRPEDYAWRRMWVKCENEMQIPETKQDVIASEIKHHWSHFYDLRKKFFIEKSISNTPRAIFFNEHFKPAYFIHIVRNGYAVMEGIKRKAQIMEGNPLSGQKHYPIELCAEQWVRSLEIVDSQKPHLENFLEISYEELTQKPDDILSSLCDFLDIPKFDISLKDISFSIHDNNASIRNMNDSSIKKLTESEIQSINKIAKDYLVRYDYFIPRS